MAKVILFASPVFFLLIGLEWWWSRLVARQPARAANQFAGGPAVGYRFNDTVANLSLGMASQVTGLLNKGVMVFFYAIAYEHLSLFAAGEFWTSWYGVLLALVLYDFCYYWLHRLGHEMSVLWAAHVVHHQSQTYNLSTALRQTSTGFLFSWVFYLPMAVLGVPPAVFAVVALIDLLYQFWVHTEYVGKLGWFDRWFCSPSNHRVHHAVNDGYLDKNYGGVLIVWDRIFGTFCVETERAVYGTRSPLNSWDPVWANLEVYAALWKDCVAAPRWQDKLLIWFKHPGWRPAGLPQQSAKPQFSMERVTTFDPPLRGGLLAFCLLLYVLLLGATVALLDMAGRNLDAATMTALASAVMVGLWALGAAMQGRISAAMAGVVLLCVLATLSAVMGWTQWHFFFKPAAMAGAIFLIFQSAGQGASQNADQGARGRRILLLAAMAFSLGGDVLLMLPGNLFIPGLASFLVAHLFYIALFRSDCASNAWFPPKKALAGTTLAAVAMYVTVFPGLPDLTLKLAVAAYAAVISLMAAQALGRARLLQTAAAMRVAMGACIFMLSDSLIAIDRFVQPLPMAAFWILSTYYAAQLLIVGNSLTAGLASTPAPMPQTKTYP